MYYATCSNQGFRGKLCIYPEMIAKGKNICIVNRLLEKFIQLNETL